MFTFVLIGRCDYFRFGFTTLNRKELCIDVSLSSFPESAFILCHSLILLSVDLSSPHVKNKMTKREFVKNLRGLIQGPCTEYLGDLYDNVYLEGHIALKAKKCVHKTTFPFERPYGKIFLHM